MQIQDLNSSVKEIRTFETHYNIISPLLSFQHMVQNQMPPTYQYAQTPGLEEYQQVMVHTPATSIPAEAAAQFKTDPAAAFTSTAITSSVTANGGVEQQTVRTRSINVR